MRLAALPHDIPFSRESSPPRWILSFGRGLFAYRNWVFGPLACAHFYLAWTSRTVPCTHVDVIGFALGAGLAVLAATIRLGCAGRVLPDSCGRGRSFRAERLVTDGWYAVCRNPLYIANAMLWSAGCLFARASWAVLPTALFVLAAYRLMLIAEEDFLRRRFGAAYREYCRRVPRFLPQVMKLCRFSVGRRPAEDCPFSLRQAIFREHDTLALLFVGAWTLCGIAGGGWLIPEWRLLIESAPGLALVLTAWLAIKIWKRTTRRVRA